MKKAATVLLTFFLFMLFTKQSRGQYMSGQQESAIEKQVDSVFNKMIKAAENLEYDTLSSGVDDSHRAGFILNGTYFTRFDSLLANVKSRSQGLAGQVISVQKEKITVLSEGIVLLAACGNAKVETLGGDSFTIKFFWSFIYEKIDSSWKVIQSHQSGYRD